MKHFILALTFSSFICNTVKSQQLSIEITSMKNADFSTVSIYDPAKYGGKSSKTISYDDITGSPFLDDHWNKGIVFAKNGNPYSFENIRINGYSGELHYLDNSGNELAIEAGQIQKIYLFNRKDSSLPAEIFVSLPDFVDAKPFVLYKVFNNGQYQLLSLKKEYVKTDPYDPRLGKTISTFYEKTFYAFYHLGRILPLKMLNQAEVEKVLQYDSNATTWLKQKKNKLHTEYDVVAFLGYFNASKQ